MNKVRPSTVRAVENGTINVFLIPLILAGVLLMGAIGFGAWAYTGMSDYKNNTDQKIAVAVEAAKVEAGKAKDAEFAEKEKYPLKSYTAPSTYGSATISYPKSWSAYVNEAQQSQTVVDGYFYPNIVPGLQSKTAYALRVEIAQIGYTDEMKKYETNIKAGKIRATPYRYAKQPDTLGTRLDGQLTPQIRGSMVLVPLRDKTLKIWTEADPFLPDFNNIILPSVSFTP